MVPFGAFGFASKRLKSITKLPVVVSNRINTPERAEAVLEETGCDMVSMARPLLAVSETMLLSLAGLFFRSVEEICDCMCVLCAVAGSKFREEGERRQSGSNQW